ncbi:hypothetical protein DCS_04065 [Drechmeria coniospora]|uniref:Uncharacterized protein n=1 Tax=Drechmeria coniospora TaxID=98403 RepID=A0A151GIZ9_DRECN|nr:hypothetical protein DCS_04065 [Drechmeria coniospora]KYK57058.1 hypothetical protein DCS_04065 [Drechmeria coniospora]
MRDGRGGEKGKRCCSWSEPLAWAYGVGSAPARVVVRTPPCLQGLGVRPMALATAAAAEHGKEGTPQGRNAARMEHGWIRKVPFGREFMHRRPSFLLAASEPGGESHGEPRSSLHRRRGSGTPARAPSSPGGHDVPTVRGCASCLEPGAMTTTSRRPARGTRPVATGGPPWRRLAAARRSVQLLSSLRRQPRRTGWCESCRAVTQAAPSWRATMPPCHDAAVPQCPRLPPRSREWPSPPSSSTEAERAKRVPWSTSSLASRRPLLHPLLGLWAAASAFVCQPAEPDQGRRRANCHSLPARIHALAPSCASALVDAPTKPRRDLARPTDQGMRPSLIGHRLRPSSGAAISPMDLFATHAACCPPTSLR